MSRPGLVAALLRATLVDGARRSPRLATLPEVDLERFLGDWYVIAHIPAFQTVLKDTSGKSMCPRLFLRLFPPRENPCDLGTSARFFPVLRRIKIGV
jgi:hypothetical protein